MQINSQAKGPNWQQAGLKSAITGIIYGLTSVIVGHPFDTIKTKMQAQTDIQTGCRAIF